MRELRHAYVDTHVHSHTGIRLVVDASYGHILASSNLPLTNLEKQQRRQHRCYISIHSITAEDSSFEANHLMAGSPPKWSLFPL